MVVLNLVSPGSRASEEEDSQHLQRVMHSLRAAHAAVTVVVVDAKLQTQSDRINRPD